MSTMTRHAPGTFCWPELGTTDQEAAKKFYVGIFGWTYKDTPMGPDAGHYTIFQANRLDAAALYSLSPDMKKQGVPPNWGNYISVTSADAAAKKAAELGATVIMQPFDVMETLGRLAVIQDPTGAAFSVWQAKDHNGVGILDEPGALCWTELLTTDPAKAGAFYTSFVGWKAQDLSMGPTQYTVFERPDGTKAAGMMKMPDDLKGVPPHWMSYFLVSDLQATTNKAKSLGAQIVMPPTPVPNVGQFAILKDPQGAAFSLLQRAS